MKPKPPLHRAPEESDAADDVEILEVVGVEESDAGYGSAPSTAEVLPWPTDAGSESQATSEYVLDLDAQGPTLAVVGGALAEPALQPGPTAASLEDAEQRLLRLRADYANLRRRIEREREEVERFANFHLVARLLPVLDNLERALAAHHGEGPHNDALREGLAMIHRELTDQLRREGLAPMVVKGQHFDPLLHDAVATEARTDVPEGTVVDEMRRGYLFRDRVLRAALVKVCKRHGDEEGA